MDLNELNVLKAQTSTNGASTNMNGLQQTAPPIPPRVNRNTTGVYSNYTPPAYGSSMYNGFSGGSNYYSGMGAGGFYGMGGVGGFSLGAPAGNTFLRTAEESSRNAFQSIESVVHAFSAVSAMFESTYYAVFNSFRAVVGVADQFYRLKNHLTRILSALAIMRFLRYLCRKLIQLIKMDFNSNPAAHSSADAWSMASHDSEKYIYDSSKRQTNWPLIMFFAVVVGGPWLIWRILSSIESINKDDRLWMTGKIDHFVAVAEHDFDGENVDEISFRRGQRITIAPKEYQPKVRGWLLGTVDGTNQGMIPANYIRILGKKLSENSNQSSIKKSASESDMKILSSDQAATDSNQ